MKAWHEGMTDKETSDLAYWERNMLALRYADGWYDDLVEDPPPSVNGVQLAVYRLKPRYAGWVRVLSLDEGRCTFHIPDDFDVGSLPKIERNWDGHTTEDKWKRIQAYRGIK